MSVFSQFGTNKDKENEGVWIDICENEDGTKCRMKIRRMATSNKQFMRLMAKKSKGRRGASGGGISDRELKTMIEVFATTVLIGWDFVVDGRPPEQTAASFPSGDGKLLFMNYSVENAIWLLTELPDLFDLLTNEANDLSNFQSTEDDDEEAAGN